MPSRSARPRAKVSARGVVPATAQPAPANSGAPPAGTVISGCSPNASWGARTSSRVAPEQCPTSGPRASAVAAAAISPSGTQRRTASAWGVAPRPSGPSTARPVARRAAARAVPSRPAPTIAQELKSGFRSSSRMRYRLGFSEGRHATSGTVARTPPEPWVWWRRAHGGGASRGAEGGLAAGTGLYALPAAGGHAPDGGLRGRSRRRGPDVRRRGARRERGRAGIAVRRAGGAAARDAARRDRAEPSGGLHRQRPALPPARQPGPAAHRGRG